MQRCLNCWMMVMATKLEAREAPTGFEQISNGDLLDVNVWLALVLREHPHHLAAQVYWNQQQLPRLWFNRVTMLALVRLLSQPKLMGAAVLNLSQAFKIYRQLVQLPEVGFREEPAHCDTVLQPLLDTQPQPLPARLWTDAYLAAFAVSAGLRLITFDRDFERFIGLNVVRLLVSD